MLMSRAGTNRLPRCTAPDACGGGSPMEFRKVGPITIGIAGGAGTSGIGIMVFRLASGQGSVMDACLVLAASFITTSLIAALGLILNYRLGKQALQTQASALQHNADE